MTEDRSKPNPNWVPAKGPSLSYAFWTSLGWSTGTLSFPNRNLRLRRALQRLHRATSTPGYTPGPQPVALEEVVRRVATDERARNLGLVFFSLAFMYMLLYAASHAVLFLVTHNLIHL